MTRNRLREARSRVELLFFHILYRLVEFLLDRATWGSQRRVLCFVATASSWLEAAFIFEERCRICGACRLPPVAELKVRCRIRSREAYLRSEVLVRLVAEPRARRCKAFVVGSSRRSGSPAVQVRLEPTLRPERKQILIRLLLPGDIRGRVQPLQFLRILVLSSPSGLPGATKLA